MTPTPAEAHFDAVLASQRAKRRDRYGTGLDHADGHDWQAEALQEALDLAQYLAAENLRLREALCALSGEAWEAATRLARAERGAEAEELRAACVTALRALHTEPPQDSGAA